MLENQDYDVFLSYSRKDTEAVERIASLLRERQLRVWLDTWELIPGRPWRDLVQKALKRVRSTAVFIGPEGFGSWEEVEMDAALEEQVSRNCPIIPVLLPRVPASIQLPAFLKRHTWVRFPESLEDEDALYRLEWGIRGEKPVRPEGGERARGTAAPPANPVQQAVGSLASVLMSGNVTYFLGPAASVGGPDLPPSSCEMSRELLQRLALTEEDKASLLPPIDLAGSYFEIKEGALSLENVIVDLIRDRARGVPPTQERLARLLRLLQNRPRRRVRARTRQLILTTNFDLMMERALLREGLPFTRIVQDRSAPRIVVNRYDVKREGDYLELINQRVRVHRDDLDRLDDLINSCGQESITFPPGQRVGQSLNPLRALPLEEDGADDKDKDKEKGPILYKHHGSQDIQSSCAISLEQYFEFVWETVHNIPKEIQDLVENCPILFLGYSFLDPEFRLVYYSLLRGRIRAGNRLWGWACRPRPDESDADVTDRIEVALWEELKSAGLSRGVTTIETSGESFLQMLIDRIQAELDRIRAELDRAG
jgi:hypothetical protein